MKIKILVCTLLIFPIIVHAGSSPSRDKRPSNIEVHNITQGFAYGPSSAYCLDLSIFSDASTKYPYLRLFTDEDPEIFVMVLSDATLSGISNLIKTIKEKSIEGKVKIFLTDSGGRSPLKIRRIITKDGILNIPEIMKKID
jgi:hypothetical protein